jgi:hypothetical protein
MTGHCFLKRNSNPPACAVHNAVLVRETLPIDPEAPYLGSVYCYVCPVTRSVPVDSH